MAGSVLSLGCSSGPDLSLVWDSSFSFKKLNRTGLWQHYSVGYGLQENVIIIGSSLHVVPIPSINVHLETKYDHDMRQLPIT